MQDTLKHFRYYLLGARIVLKTDHKPLLKLLEQKDPFGRRATMIRDISEFEPYIEFIRGQDNFMADALSRLGLNTQLPQDDNPSVVATSYPGSFFGEGKTLVGAGHVTVTKLIA